VTRWYALDLSETPLGPAYEARDRTDALDYGCGLYGPRVALVQSVVSWEVAEAERARHRRLRSLRRTRGAGP
jgi:hypothetical protein